MLSEAPTFEEINHAQELQRIHDAREAAGDLVHGDDLLDLLLKTYEQNGLVGEQHIAASTSLVFVRLRGLAGRRDRQGHVIRW